MGLYLSRYADRRTSLERVAIKPLGRRAVRCCGSGALKPCSVGRSDDYRRWGRRHRGGRSCTCWTFHAEEAAEARASFRIALPGVWVRSNAAVWQLRGLGEQAVNVEARRRHLGRLQRHSHASIEVFSAPAHVVCRRADQKGGCKCHFPALKAQQLRGALRYIHR